MYFWSVNYYRNSTTGSLLVSMCRLRPVRISMHEAELAVAGGIFNVFLLVEKKNLIFDYAQV